MAGVVGRSRSPPRTTGRGYAAQITSSSRSRSQSAGMPSRPTASATIPPTIAAFVSMSPPARIVFDPVPHQPGRRVGQHRVEQPGLHRGVAAAVAVPPRIRPVCSAATPGSWPAKYPASGAIRMADPLPKDPPPRPASRYRRRSVTVAGAPQARSHATGQPASVKRTGGRARPGGRGRVPRARRRGSAPSRCRRSTATARPRSPVGRPAARPRSRGGSTFRRGRRRRTGRRARGGTGRAGRRGRGEGWVHSWVQLR